MLFLTHAVFLSRRTSRCKVEERYENVTVEISMPSTHPPAHFDIAPSQLLSTTIGVMETHARMCRQGGS